MIERFYIHGCSHTSGHELAPGQSVRELSWANNVANMCEAKVIHNEAQAGGSNDHIIEQTFEYCTKIRWTSHIEKLFVIIGWTGEDRLFLKSDEPGETRWNGYYLFMPGLLDPPKPLLPMKKNHKIMYTELLKTDWGKWYNVQYRMVLKMYTLQCFLKELNVPYLFLNMLHPFQQSKINDMHKTKLLYKFLDKKRIYKGGETVESVYYERFKKDKYSFNFNEHLGQEGQDAFAKEVYQYIKENDLLLR
jgi:hypothetical protein